VDSICGVVTLYNPDIESAAHNINCYLKYIDHLLIWANSPIEDKESFLDLLSERDKVDFIQCKENAGICKPLNAGVRAAQDGGYKYLLTMDQDSTWIDFPAYFDKAMRLRREDSSISITGPAIAEVEEGTAPSEIKAPGGISYDSYVITSGAIYDVSMFDKTGGFTDVYFIDAADEDICLRATLKGYKYAVIGDCVIAHQFGNKTEHRLFGRTVVTHSYSAMRYYYIVRNHIWLMRSGYVPFSHKCRLFKMHVVEPFIRALLFEENRGPKLSSVMRGIKDGLSNKHKAEWKRC